MSDNHNDRTYLATIEPERRAVMETLRNSLYPGASYPSIEMVMAWCSANKVDPFLKAVHIVPMSVKKPGTKDQYEWRDVLMPGIADYRIKAARSGEYAGKSEPEFGPIINARLSGVDVSYPEWCKVTVRRHVRGSIAEFTALEYWVENYATAKRDTSAPNAMWARRARGQLAKVAEAQALRMAFPEFNGGTPTAEEMEGRFPDAAPEPPRQGSRLDQANDAFHGTTIEAEPEVFQWPGTIDALGMLDAVDKMKWLALVSELAAVVPTLDDWAEIQNHPTFAKLAEGNAEKIKGVVANIHAQVHARLSESGEADDFADRG